MIRMKDRWNYTGLGRVAYGHPITYSLPARWFDEIGGLVEDWGCGCAAFKEYLVRCTYIGLDGSPNEYADRCDVELCEYRSSADHILLRHVLDHNERWRELLANAVASFKRRMVLVIFHDLGPETKILFRHDSPKFKGVPDLQFKEEDLLSFFREHLVRREYIPADESCPNNETLFYLEKV